MSRSRRGGRWKPGDQRSPRLPTIVVAAILVGVAAVLTFGLPTLVEVFGLSASVAETLELVGVGAAVAAMILMLLGVFLRGL